MSSLKFWRERNEPTKGRARLERHATRGSPACFTNLARARWVFHLSSKLENSRSLQNMQLTNYDVPISFPANTTGQIYHH